MSRPRLSTFRIIPIMMGSGSPNRTNASAHSKNIDQNLVMPVYPRVGL
jgi:hypothetical protein